MRSRARRTPGHVTSVLLVTPRWIRDGGVATHVMASASALAERGVSVSVLAARIDAAAEIPGVRLFHSPELFNGRATPAERFGEALSIRPGVIHLHQFEDPDAVAAMRRHAPVLLSAHGYLACTSGVHYFRPGQECQRAHGLGCIPNLVACAHTSDPRGLPSAFRQAGRSLVTLRRADLALSYSTAVDRHLALNQIARRKVIPLFSTMVPAVGSGHADRRRVVFAGRVVLPKGIAVLIRAARAVDAEFVVCGDGWRLEEMRRLAKRTGVHDRVQFKGWLGSEELAGELANASVVAVPSIWPEPFGLVGIEAFAAGRPVVASATGGMRDWLEHDVNGLAVEPGDADALARALRELLADPARAQALGAAGKAMAERRFSAERHVAALLDAYGSARERWESSRDGSSRLSFCQ
jgi:glycosyltransferase involved in cell wall biosynthesis